MKLSVIVMSDPRGGDEALGRLFNALALVSEAHRAEDEVELVFQGAGTRWPKELARPDHPAYALYESVRTQVAGASRGCAAVFGAAEDLTAARIPALGDNDLGDGVQVASLRTRLAAGTTVVF
jgi:hypothetical protein